MQHSGWQRISEGYYLTHIAKGEGLWQSCHYSATRDALTTMCDDEAVCAELLEDARLHCRPAAPRPRTTRREIPYGDGFIIVDEDGVIGDIPF